MTQPLVQLDGADGEGGGQIVRTAVALAAITGQGVEISSIRAGRATPGLQAQHLAAVQAAAALCGAALAGAARGSSFLRFQPAHPPLAGDYHFEIGTAGAATLVLQTVLLPLALAAAPSRVRIVGGTHVPHAPTADYLTAVYLPALQRAGIHAQVAVPRAGFYPRGGGELLAEVAPSPYRRLLDDRVRGPLQALQAHIVTSGLPAHVAERGQTAVAHALRGISRQVRVTCADKPASGPGAAVTLAAVCAGGLAGFSALGERGKPMERVAEEACDACTRWWESDAACDEHLADQLVLPMALTAGESRWTTPVVCAHQRTVLAVVGRFLPGEGEIEEPSGAPCTVTLRSAGAPQ